MEQPPFPFHWKTIQRRRKGKRNWASPRTEYNHKKDSIVLQTYLISWHQHRTRKLHRGQINDVYRQIKYWSYVSSLHMNDSFLWTMSWPTCIWNREAYETLDQLRAAVPYFRGRIILNEKTLRKERELRCLPTDVQSLSLPCTQRLTENVFYNLQQITDLSLHLIYETSSNLFASNVLGTLTRLTRLVVVFSNGGLFANRAICHSPYLKHFSYRGHNRQSAFPRHDLPNLTKLVVEDCRIRARSFPPYTDLRKLKIVNCNVESGAIKSITNLQCLDMTQDHMTYGDRRKQIHLTDEDFEQLNCLKSVHIPKCELVSDNTFYSFTRVSNLSIRGCSQSYVTDNAFLHLGNVTYLDMKQCNQRTITDEAFRYLTNVVHLDISGCHQPTISDKAFQCLQNLTHLDMIGCSQPTITHHAFYPLTNIVRLDVSQCNQTTIKDGAFRHLSQLSRLRMYGVSRRSQLTGRCLEKTGDITFYYSTLTRKHFLEYINVIKRIHAYRSRKKIQYEGMYIVR
jgi:Leucine-rich repeat (LRR) protein